MIDRGRETERAPAPSTQCPRKPLKPRSTRLAGRWGGGPAAVAASSSAVRTDEGAIAARCHGRRPAQPRGLQGSPGRTRRGDPLAPALPLLSEVLLRRERPQDSGSSGPAASPRRAKPRARGCLDPGPHGRNPGFRDSRTSLCLMAIHPSLDESLFGSNPAPFPSLFLRGIGRPVVLFGGRPGDLRLRPGAGLHLPGAARRAGQPRAAAAALRPLSSPVCMFRTVRGVPP